MGNAPMPEGRSLGCSIVAAVLLAAVLVDGLPLPSDTQGIGLVQLGAGQDPGTLNCHELGEEQASCCIKGMQGWRAKQVMFKDVEDARLKLLTAPEETATLRNALDAAEAAWANSQTKLTYQQGIRECANSPTAYTLPETSVATAARMAADADLQKKEEEVSNAKHAAETALDAQANMMAQYTETVGNLDAVAATADSASAASQQAQIALQAAQEHAAAVDKQAQDAEAAATAAAGQVEAAQKAVDAAKANFQSVKTEGEAKIAEFDQSLDDLKATETTKKQEKTTAANELSTAEAGGEAAAVSQAQEVLSAAADAAQALATTEESASTAKAKQQNSENALQNAQSEKTNMLEKADELATQAKEAENNAASIEQEAAEAKQERDTAVTDEENQMAVVSGKKMEAQAVRWDEQYDALKVKVNSVSEMYDRFMACVKDSKWAC